MWMDGVTNAVACLRDSSSTLDKYVATCDKKWRLCLDSEVVWGGRLCSRTWWWFHHSLKYLVLLNMMTLSTCVNSKIWRFLDWLLFKISSTLILILTIFHSQFTKLMQFDVKIDHNQWRNINFVKKNVYGSSCFYINIYF